MSSCLDVIVFTPHVGVFKSDSMPIDILKHIVETGVRIIVISEDRCRKNI